MELASPKFVVKILGHGNLVDAVGLAAIDLKPNIVRCIGHLLDELRFDLGNDHYYEVLVAPVEFGCLVRQI